MNFKDDEELLPTGKGGFEKGQLKRDEKPKSFWEGLAQEWLKFRSGKATTKKKSKVSQ